MKAFFHFNLILLTALALVGCKDSKKNDSSPNTTLKQQYDTSSQRLQDAGASFTTSEANGTYTIILNFDELNATVRNAKSTEEKINILTTANDAMKDFEKKALALIDSKTLGVNEHNIVVKKYRMIIERSKSINPMITSYKTDLREQKEAAARKIDKPFVVKIGTGKESSEFMLCEKNIDNLKLKSAFPSYYNNENGALEDSYYYNDDSSIKNDLNIIKLILCSEVEIRQKAASLFSKYKKSKHSAYATPLFVDIEKGYRRSVISIPLEMDKVRNRTITTQFKYNSDESPANANLIVEIPVLELLFLVDHYKSDSLELLKYIEKRLMNDGDDDILADFERLYSNKNEILVEYTSPSIKQLLLEKFEKSYTKTTDEIINFIITKNYQDLKQFSNSKNCNTVSYNKSLRVNSAINAYGLSPLMVAAILNDNHATEILLAVEGINPNYESPVFKKTYKTIGSYSVKAISHLQSYGGYGGNGGSDGGSYSNNIPQKYRGYTALMIAIEENQCEIVDTIIETEPHTLNYKTTSGRSALQISIYNSNRCLDQLLKAGAFDITLLLNGFITKSTTGDILDFVKYVKNSTFQSEEVKKVMPKLLVFSALDIKLKKELNKKVPVTHDQVKKLIGNMINVSHSYDASLFGTYHYVDVRYEFDLKFINHLNIDLAKEKIFSDSDDKSKDTIFGYVFTSIQNPDLSKSTIETALVDFLNSISEINPKWVTDWVNSTNSFKGQNPLVAASMFNEVGLVNALVAIDGINVNVLDEKTQYNALEWQYATNPFIWLFTYSNIASDLKDKGAKIRVPVNVFGTPNSTIKQDMNEKLKSTPYPFKEKSATTKMYSGE